MTVLQSLGDSFSCGEGVGVRVPVEQTWAGRLAAALDRPHLPLATAGARVCDVVDGQLPHARAAAVTTLLVGLNDVARTGFDARQVRSGMHRCVQALSGCSDRIVLGRLQDPSRMLWLPAPLRGLARSRVAAVNATVDELADWPRVAVLDLEAVPQLRRPGAWAVDRVHPSRAGHAALAAAAAALLGVTVAPVPLPRAPGLLARAHWTARHGAPYVAGQLLGAVIAS